MTTYGSILDTLKAPATPTSARTIKGRAGAPDNEPAAPAAQPKEDPMPRGVYDRTKKEGSTPPPELKKRRKYTRRAKAAKHANGEGGDLKTLALEALVAAGQHLVTTVRLEIAYEDNETVVQALRGYELAARIHKAAGA